MTEAKDRAQTIKELSSAELKAYTKKCEGLSLNGQKLLVDLSTTAGPIGKWFLEGMAEDHKFNLKKGMEELQKANLMETTTFVQELRERAEQGDFHARRNLERYEKYPEKLKEWEEPKYGISAQTKAFVQHLRTIWEREKR